MKHKFVSCEDELDRELRNLVITFVCLVIVGSLLIIADLVLIVIKSRQ